MCRDPTAMQAQQITRGNTGNNHLKQKAKFESGNMEKSVNNIRKNEKESACEAARISYSCESKFTPAREYICTHCGAGLLCRVRGRARETQHLTNILPKREFAASTATTNQRLSERANIHVSTIIVKDV